MGNSNQTLSGKQKWSEKSHKSSIIHSHDDFVTACAIGIDPDPNNENHLIIASSTAEKIFVSSITTQLSKNGNNIKKIKCKRIGSIDVSQRGVEICTLDFSLNTNKIYIALAGGPNTYIVQIFYLQLSETTPYRELQMHTQSISQVKFMDTNLIFSASNDGTIISWDIERQCPLKEFGKGLGLAVGISSFDYILLSKQKILIYGDYNGKIFINDINRKKNLNGNHDESAEDWFNDNPFLVDLQTEFGNFNQNKINSLRISPNGQFFCAIGNDGTFEIYHKNERLDTFWNRKVIEWIFLDKQFIENINFNGLCLSWIDNETFMIGMNSNKSIICFEVIPQKIDPQFIKVTLNGIENIIKSLKKYNMDWIGLKNDILNQVLLFCGKWSIQKYSWKRYKNDIDTLCIASCHLDKPTTEYIPFDENDEKEMEKAKQSKKKPNSNNKQVYIYGGSDHNLYVSF